MNTPGVAGGNWQWRFRAGELNDWHVGRLADMAELYGRAPEKPDAAKKPSAATGTVVRVAADGNGTGDADAGAGADEPAGRHPHG